VNRRRSDRLRTAAELFPEIADPALDSGDGPSCSAVEALERQEPFVNSSLSNLALALLARLFRQGKISHHGAFLSLAAARMQPIPVDPNLWRALRRRASSSNRRARSLSSATLTKIANTGTRGPGSE
jgi:hypothetical protein